MARLDSDMYITRAPGLEFLPPYYSNYGDRPGRRIILRCKVKSETLPNVTWEKIMSGSSNNTARLLTPEVDNRIQIRLRRMTKSRYVSKLNIVPSRVLDTGLYRCTITTKSNAILQREFKVNVNVSVLTPVRLGSVAEVGQGRLEIYHRRKWGLACQHGFTSVEASVVCRSLGYRYGGEPRFWFEKANVLGSGRVTDPIWIKGFIHCSLNATDIKQCSGWTGRPLCYFLLGAVGVTCRRTPVEVPDVPVRLITNTKAKDLPEGFVEVFKDGHWGTICYNNIGQSEVNVICKMLGFHDGGTKFKAEDIYSLNNPGKGKQILQNLMCPDNALNIDDCSHAPWGEQCTACGCGQRNNFAVRCWTNELNNTKSVRLAGSNIPHEGRVEVLHNGIWGTVASQWIGQPGANVLCKMMGYQYGGLPLYDNIAPGQGPIWIYYIECPLNASDLKECKFKWGAPSFRGRNDVGVRCRLKPVKVPDVKIRLVGPRGFLGGRRLEVFRDGYWGTVCRAYMGTSEASLFCHMLGYRYGGYIKENPDSWPQLKPDYGPSLIEYMECPWNSTKYNQCSQRYWAYRNNRLRCTMHGNDAALTCRDKPYPEYEVKLIGGKRENSGMLTVKFQDTWLKVCRTGFKSRNLVPICKQLGYRHGGEFRIKREARQPSLLLECNGKEQNIGQCNGIKNALFDHMFVHVKCYLETDIELQMTVSQESDGKIILHRKQRSWKFCPESWDDVGANTACQMLGNRTGTATYVPYETSNRKFPPAGYNIDEFYCPRHSRHLADCFYSSWDAVTCTNDNQDSISRGGAICDHHV